MFLQSSTPFSEDLDHTQFQVFAADGDEIFDFEYEITKAGLTIIYDDNACLIRSYHIDRIAGLPNYVEFGPEIKKNRVVNSMATEKTTIAASLDADISKVEFNPVKLKDNEFDPSLFVPMKTNTYLDKFMTRKGGIMPGTNMMITGESGVAKSSAILFMMDAFVKANPEKRALYVSAEMMDQDLEEFRHYYPTIEETIDFLFADDYIGGDATVPFYKVLMKAVEDGYELIAMDSLIVIQQIVGEELGMNSTKSEKWILDLMKRGNRGINKKNVYTSFLPIQQVTKGGEFVGTNYMRHMTHMFLQLKRCTIEKGKRYMIMTKNRKGLDGIKLYFHLVPGGFKFDEVRHGAELEFRNMDTTSVDETAVSDFKKQLLNAQMNRQQGSSHVIGNDFGDFE